MKCSVFLLAILVISVCNAVHKQPQEKSNIRDSVQRFIDTQGYDSEIHTVHTEDGYILQLVRIPRGRTSNSQETTDEGKRKSPVLLMPGMMSTYEDFVVGGPNEALAFALSDEGYDVYIANARGSLYGQKHSTLDARRDVAFWRYSWHEVGVKDLPAIIDKVLQINGQNKVNFIGHMEGSTAFYTMASSRPEYNNKIKIMVALGPIVFMQNTKNEFLKELDRKIEEHEEKLASMQKPRGNVWHSGWMMQELGLNTETISDDIMNEMESKCINSGYDTEICGNSNFLINGYNSKNLDKSTVEKIIKRTPSPASSRQILHYVQVMASGKFQKYDNHFDRTDTRDHPRSYDLSNVETPVAIFYTPDDTWSQDEDVQNLISKLPNVVHKEKLPLLSNNFDLIFSKNVNDNVNKKVLAVMKAQHADYRKLKNNSERRQQSSEENGDVSMGFDRQNSHEDSVESRKRNYRLDSREDALDSENNSGLPRLVAASKMNTRRSGDSDSEGVYNHHRQRGAHFTDETTGRRLTDRTQEQDQW